MAVLWCGVLSAVCIVANLVAVAKECESIPEYLRRLAEFARDPARLMGTTIE